MIDPDSWISLLGLTRHPEGGWYRETYRSADTIPSEALPSGYEGARSCATAIYFLLCRDDFSALHRLASDELWHFYAGNPLTVHVISRDGMHERLLLGRDIAKGEQLQALVPKGVWFGAVVEPPGEYALVGCTVTPGFDFRDFELGRRDDLLAEYPDYAALIRSLTR
jgi:hypothetical protein